VSQWQTLECISNDVGGDFMSTARWDGVPVAALLDRAGGVDPRAKKAVFYAADGYADSFPVAQVLDSGALLATAMNDETLPAEHGYPVRLLVPGTYGMKNVKWVTIIELVDTDFRGYWQQRGWTDDATVKTLSRIDVPRKGTAAAAGITRIAGVAFAGRRGISRVEVSDDGGETWRPATLRAPKGPYTWTLWEVPWGPPPGQYRLAVRATDGTGALQRSEKAPTLPDGASGYHTVTVTLT
jgi:DMSO/TMAO reductase YedYZ molybdopterin-dependent catalytic subunit